jgi:hypothetical protein
MECVTSDPVNRRCETVTSFYRERGAEVIPTAEVHSCSVTFSEFALKSCRIFGLSVQCFEITLAVNRSLVSIVLNSTNLRSALKSA